MLEGAHAVVFNLTLRFRTSDILHRRSVVKRFAIIIRHMPHARRAGFSCAAACNPGGANARAFVRHRFDPPLPFKMLHAHTGVAALAVQRVAAAHFSRAIIAAVDGATAVTCSAVDEEDIACAHCCSG